MSAARGARSPRWGAALTRALPAVLWAALIFAFSAQPELPHVPPSLLDLLLKKSAHMAEYAVLALLVWRALRPSGPDLRRGDLLRAWALAVLYAVSDEVHQSFVPGRTPAALDVLIDGLGALLGLTLLVIVGRLRAATRAQAASPVGARRS